MLPASLGRQIKLLEESLGTRLLVRTTRSVSLTESGRSFVDAARDIVEQADRLEVSFRENRQDQASILRIGAIDSAAVGLMPQLLPHFRELHSDIDVELLEQKTIRLLPRLLSGRLDIAIVRPPEVRDARLFYQHLFYETAVVAVPESHPLAKRKTVTVQEMADAPLIVPERNSRPHSHDLTMKLFLEAGLTARVAQIAEEKQTIVSLVSTGVGLAIVPRWASRLAVGGVTFVSLELPDTARNRLAVSAVWVRDARHPARDAFLNVLKDRLSALAETA
ncbi:LysR family transcriptional regulator [Marivita cryptomonadis]|uniref:LysR family transcriptional regulator n=2 Tax=Roseobacteraceae TaxID=2854170 RepID=A0A9Q2S1V5_9RHOB|nr:LysR family transcriptional regulator [Marivita cryptomonadis]MBM2333406.1 LysR family transcriptional regulator [Marivita cryptomonadis]MBM2342984.1 LysR family transcriptional regulator [Marivita cryptomonadis]MBM2347655.1 LysR family transcriptional regulator [Marivita cryptomonadis]MBM2352337.1 LysR family transcriptional regulator [Marivita cryptomonadis]